MIAVYNDAEWVSHTLGPGLGVQWVASMPRGELRVFGDDSMVGGAWAVFVRDERGVLFEAANGTEGNEPDGKLRARAVYEALTARLQEVR